MSTVTPILDYCSDGQAHLHINNRVIVPVTIMVRIWPSFGFAQIGGLGRWTLAQRITIDEPYVAEFGEYTMTITRRRQGTINLDNERVARKVMP